MNTTSSCSSLHQEGDKAEAGKRANVVEITPPAATCRGFHDLAHMPLMSRSPLLAAEHSFPSLGNLFPDLSQAKY